MDYESRGSAPDLPAATGGVPGAAEGEYLPSGTATAGWQADRAHDYAANPWPDGRHQQETEFGRTDVPLEHTNRKRGIAGTIAAGGALLLKFAGSLKFILFGLLKAPFLISILLNVVIYAVLYSTRLGPVFGLAYGGGIVGLILVHEMGHMVAARMTDTETTNPLFIPFMGAVIGVKSYRNATIEAINGIGGPVLGTIGTIAVLGWANALGFDSQWGHLLLRLAYIGFFINLFNMVPVTLGGGFTLDGGRVLQAISKWAFVIGPLILLAGLFTGVLQSFFFWIFVILGAFGAYRQFGRPVNPQYHTTTLPGKIFIAAAYFFLLGVLVMGTAFTESSFTGGF
ncbi:MAG TPA: site-2 protease family protein [Candidatus Dormibacteraeota bacterium]|nr:site-2 protease family protein [Candidatus Dormibacteraeota bacterium]